MKKTLLSAAAFLCALVLVFVGVFAVVTATMPNYRDNAGDGNYTEKMTGLYLVQQSAQREDNLIIFGSSELRTTEISTHPANFFAGKRAGFQVNLVGRGSCQSLTHAMAIAASGDALRGKKVVLITSPQSYVPEGIVPDLFAANFSAQQYLELLTADDLSDEVKRDISARVGALLGDYEAAPPYIGTQALASHIAAPTLFSDAKNKECRFVALLRIQPLPVRPQGHNDRPKTTKLPTAGCPNHTTPPYRLGQRGENSTCRGAEHD